MTLPKLGFTLLLVENPLKSAEFYQTLFGIDPAEKFPTFAMFALQSGTMLGLWSRYTAEPAVMGQAGASELCFEVEDVDALYAHCAQHAMTIMQKPTQMFFGWYTFVLKDPDGHRIRLYQLRDEK